jgi:hypothetical protein
MSPRSAVTFQCRECRLTWEGAPARKEDAPELTHHPWRYFANCKGCGDEVGQAPWERGLMKAWVNATGPKTDEGKAATARNLEGHPSPEEAKHTRFNAMKHGMNAKTATYFPAKPDGYSFCSACEVDRTWCRAQPACVKKTELFMLHQAAFEQRDPKKLMGVYSELHSAIFAVLQQILQTIIADGVKLVSPQYYTDKEGTMILCTYMDPKTFEQKTIYDVEAHPLFRPLGELLSRTGLSLSEMGMTTKVIENADEEMGRLAASQQVAEEISDFQRAQTSAMQAMVDRMERGKTKTEADPVLLEYNQQTGESKPVREGA